MSNSEKKHTPTLVLNNIPLTTEEPVRRPWLKEELEDINKDSDTEGYLGDNFTADENDATTGESSSDDESLNGQNKIKNIMETPEDTAAEVEHLKKEFVGNDIMACMAHEMAEYEQKQEGETEEYEQQVANAQTEDDLLNAADPDLLRRTESNRHIPYDEVLAPRARSNSVHGESDVVHRNLLVFSDNPSIIEQPNKLTVVQYYGAGKSGVMPFAFKQRRKTKAYLVACDFSKESIYAIEWTMGTMMRDGDELHIAAVVNREDNPDVVKATGLDQAGEVYFQRYLQYYSNINFHPTFTVACSFGCFKS